MAETPHFTYSLQVGDAADSDCAYNNCSMSK